MLRPDEPTVIDEINGESVEKPDPATLMFNTINRLNQGAYGPKDTVIRDPNFIIPTVKLFPISSFPPGTC
jgi:hypothetical protein